MNIQELMAGIAVIIDDEIEKSGTNIQNIVGQLKALNIPYLTYSQTPDNAIVSNFKDISFVVLDWEYKALQNEAIQEGVRMSESTDDIGDSAVEFIKNLKDVCFVPIFIFSNASTEDIRARLVDENLYKEGEHNYIFIESKEAVKEHLFTTIQAWLEGTPSVYSLKEWDRAFYKARHDLFWNFYEINPNWPKILWKAYMDDGVDMSAELGEIITRNLHSRIKPFQFESSVFDLVSGEIVSKENIRAVLEGERFIPKDSLHPEDVQPGDIFKITNPETSEDQYFLNIRPVCDTVLGRCGGNPELYCLKGRIVDETLINQESGHKFHEGAFIEKVNNSIIFSIDGGKIIEFLFREIKLKKWTAVSSNRIGRLLPPFLTKVQQNYGLYMQRQGLPRIPVEAVH